MKRICVYCGSSLGKEPIFQDKAYELGTYMGNHQIDLVYGGASVGLMGKVADGALAAGGKVFGVLPVFLKTKEIAHSGLSKLFETDTMHERKMIMQELSDGFIAMPGGFGTLEELFEMLTWAQLGLHQKPIGLLNVHGYFDALLQMISHMEACQLLRPEHKMILVHDDQVEGLIDKMRQYTPPEAPKWMDREDV
jgi:uncharacterized protein (TIGR00730 family)